MTATIAPKNQPNLVRTDPVTRLQDYVRALDFYLSLIDRPLDAIVFVENSDSDISSLRKIVEDRGLAERVEFLCNYGAHMHSEMTRGYGECTLLDYAMSESLRVRQAGESDLVWKITGRYIVKNLRSVISSAPREFDIYVDMKNRPLRWMDTRLMAWTPKGYEQALRGAADDLGSTLDESVMRDYLPKRAREARLVQRFRTEPLVDGFRGFDNQNYSQGRNLLKFYVRSIARVVAPWYWI